MLIIHLCFIFYFFTRTVQNEHGSRDFTRTSTYEALRILYVIVVPVVVYRWLLYRYRYRYETTVCKPEFGVVVSLMYVALILRSKPILSIVICRSLMPAKICEGAGGQGDLDGIQRSFPMLV